jgi:hypothetical protein
LGSTALSLLAWPLAARSQTTPVSGAALAQAVLDRPAGDDATSLITMSLGEAGRPGRTRQLVSYRATPATGRSTTLIRFLAPRDIAGTGLLSLSDGKGRTDQSLYLPALAKVRRIASDRRGGRFVGSDIFFEDLQERQVDQDTHTLQGRTQLDGVECHVLQSNPVDGDDSVYRQRLSWVDVQTLVVRRVDYVERDAAAPTKRLEVLKVQQIQGLWTVMDSVVTDLTSGHQTRMQVERIQYNRRLPGKLFTPRALSDEGLEAEYRP